MKCLRLEKRKYEKSEITVVEVAEWKNQQEKH
jgi:hypothetical protein